MIFIIRNNKANVMPYTRYVDNSNRLKRTDSLGALKSMESKIYNGDAITVMKDNFYGGSEIELVRYVSVDYKTNNYSNAGFDSAIDDITEYTSRFGYNNGYACIFVTFTSIHPILAEEGENYLLCIEVENFVKSTYGKCQAINVFNRSIDERFPNQSLKNITWISFADIEVNVEYCIYLIASEYVWRNKMYRWIMTAANVNNGPWTPNFPSDWEMRLNVRPSIRNVGGHHYLPFQKSLQHFTLVRYPIAAERQV